MRMNLVLFGGMPERISRFSDVMNGRGLEVQLASTIEEIGHLLTVRRIDAVVIICDGDGVDHIGLLSRIRSIDDDIPIVFLMEELDKDLIISMINRTEVYFLECGEDDVDGCIDLITASMEKKSRLRHPGTGDVTLWKVLQDIVDWTWKLDKEGNFVYSTVSESSKVLSDPGDLRADRLLDLIPAIDAGRIGKLLDDAERTMEPLLIDDLRVLTRSGRILHFIVRATPARLMDGSYAGMMGLCVNITDRVEALERVSMAEEWNSVILDSVPEAVIVLDTLGTVKMVNRKGVELFGFSSAEEATGVSSFQLIPPDEIERVMRDFTAVLNGAILPPGDYNVLRKDGTRFRSEVSSAATLYDKTGRPESVVMVFRDVTERDRLREDIESSRSRYKQIVENVPGFVWETDPDLCLTYVSPSCARYGLMEEDLLTTSLFDVMEDRDKARIAEELETKLDSHGFRDLTFRMRDGNGKGHVMLLSGSSFYGEGNVLKGYRGIMREITENVKTLRDFDDTWDRYQMTLENVGELIWTSDLEGTVTYLTPELRRYCNIDIGQSLSDAGKRLLNDADIAKIQDAYESLIAAGAMVNRTHKESRNIEIELRRRDGSTMWVDHRISMLRDRDGVAMGLLGIGRDITERKRSHQKALSSYNFLKHAFWNTPESIIVVDFITSSPRIVECNKAACDSLGYEYEEIVGMRLNEIIMGVGREEMLQLRDMMIAGNDMKIEGVHRRRNGTFFDVETSLFLSERDGAPVVFAVARDITDFKRDRMTMQRRDRELQAFNRLIVNITESDDVDEIIHKTMPLIKDLGGYNVGATFIIERDGYEMTGAEGFDKDQLFARFKEEPAFAAHLLNMTKAAEPEFLDNMSEGSEEARAWGIESAASLPFKMDADRYCVMMFASTSVKEMPTAEKETIVAVWKLIRKAVENSEMRRA